MSTTDTPARTPRLASRARFLVALVSGAVAIGIVVAVFVALDQPDTASGAATGGAVVLLLMALARWRSRRSPAQVSTAARLGAGVPDERDKSIVSGALSLVGGVSFLLASVGLACVMAGLDARAVLGLTVLALAVTLVVSLVVLERRG
ncbi:hypothetical protein Cch01nite_31300 [Cellulomonas chitinilytica]|uniref:DUF2178 domain-containing protein n=1 Tax=Cellulomonas chitinilytica TaxID=398759 RepID=A0A919P2V7_9CELL|nr:hypothetical protein [Cellulomonas chitinilytica]GIG22406.1 hypothetical protein Cch01nite_31300 [Cellulomonas chitinilytica]